DYGVSAVHLVIAVAGESAVAVAQQHRDRENVARDDVEFAVAVDVAHGHRLGIPVGGKSAGGAKGAVAPVGQHQHTAGIALGIGQHDIRFAGTSEITQGHRLAADDAGVVIRGGAETAVALTQQHGNRAKKVGRHNVG